MWKPESSHELDCYLLMHNISSGGRKFAGYCVHPDSVQQIGGAQPTAVIRLEGGDPHSFGDGQAARTQIVQHTGLAVVAPIDAVVDLVQQGTARIVKWYERGHAPTNGEGGRAAGVPELLVSLIYQP